MIGPHAERAMVPRPHLLIGLFAAPHDAFRQQEPRFRSETVQGQEEQGL